MTKHNHEVITLIDAVDAPSVFISYSHDSPAHRQWVAELASRLRNEAGINAKIDQWEVGPGDDIGQFMEQSVVSSDNVLMICSEIYTQKVNEGIGGAGYEGGIVRGELIEKLGTGKFIPIIPPGNSKRSVPVCVKTKLYLDMSSKSEDEYKARFEDLVVKIKKYRHSQKPALSISPEFQELEHSKMSILKKASSVPEAEASPLQIYNQARAIIATNDSAEWQKLVRRLKMLSCENLRSFRKKYNQKPITSIDEAKNTACEAVETHAKLFAVAIAGVESNVNLFRHQIALTADILSFSNWERSGMTFWVELPSTVAYIYHSLIGAIAIKTRQFDLAFEQANFRIVNTNNTEKLLQNHALNGYEPSLDSNFINGVCFLQSIFSQWTWLTEFFESQADYSAAIASYNIVLIFCDLANTPSPPTDAKDYSPWSVPPAFLLTGYEAIRRTKQFILSDAQQIQNYLKHKNVDSDTIIACWDCYFSRWANSHFSFNYNIRDAEEQFRDLAREVVEKYD